MRTLAHSARRVRQEAGGQFLPPLRNMLPSPVDLPDRVAFFLARVAKSDGCWEWTGVRNGSGYGLLWLGRKNLGAYSSLAHRMAYWLWVEPIPDGLTIDHLCRNRGCVRPSHLEAVTPSENARRAARVTTHCPEGHEYTPENTYRHEKKCKQCVRARQRAAYHEGKGK